MLADNQTSISPGQLDPQIHFASEQLYALLDFISDELPRWRDHVDRMQETSEVLLTDQLCSYLNSAAYSSTAWSRIQFRTEVHREKDKRRAIDLAANPRVPEIFVEGRRHTQFDPLIPIECKRLPTPKEKDRDEREYVVTSPGTTGGIQRFKFGHHGASHKIAGMIGYVQEEDSAHWLGKINGWITDLSSDSTSGWSKADVVKQANEDSVAGVCKLDSRHKRKDLDDIEIRHIWIAMDNPKKLVT